MDDTYIFEVSSIDRLQLYAGGMRSTLWFLTPVCVLLTGHPVVESAQGGVHLSVWLPVIMCESEAGYNS